MHLASFGPYVIMYGFFLCFFLILPYVIMYGFFLFFFDTNLLVDVYIGFIYILQGRGGLRCAVVTKTGHRFSFFFFFHTNLLFDGYIGSIDVLKGPGGLHWVAVTKTGPNDASGVIWAISNNVWFFLVFFLILTYFLMSI